MAPQVDPDRVAAGDEVDAGALRDQRDLIDPGAHAGPVSPGAFDRLEHRDGEGVIARRHGGSSSVRVPPALLARIAGGLPLPLSFARPVHPLVTHRALG